MGVFEHARRHLRRAAELARQRPFRADRRRRACGRTPAPRRGARDLLDLRLAIDGIQPHAELEGAENVALFLDRVAEGDAVGRRAGGQRLLDLDHRGAIEAGAELGEQRQDFRRRIGLDGVEHARVRQRLGEGGIIVAHDVEVDDEAGGGIRPASRRLRRNSRIRSVIAASLRRARFRARTTRLRMDERQLSALARWRREKRKTTPSVTVRPRAKAPPDGRVLRRGREKPGRRQAIQGFSGLRLEWEVPFRTPGKKDKPLR